MPGPENLKCYPPATECGWEVVDAHEQITTPYCRCPYCKKRTVTKKGGVKDVQYYHEFTAFILAGPKISFILDIEPILPGEGEVKLIQTAFQSMQKLSQGI
ncbi:hypothetical protein ES705_00002 [subsurface metagenome]|nr:hypothetical protein [Clostridia bacterium]